MRSLYGLQAYWLAVYEGISLTEHFVYKRGFSGYDITIWKNPTLLPPGIAAMGAFLMGALGASMGMAQASQRSQLGALSLLLTSYRSGTLRQLAS